MVGGAVESANDIVDARGPRNASPIRTNVRAGQNIAIGTPTPSVVAHVAVKAGDNVTAGDELFTLDDRTLRAEQKLRESALLQAEGKLEKAAQLIGTVDAAREREREERSVLEQRTYEALVTSVREALGSGFTVLYEQGRALSRE